MTREKTVNITIDNKKVKAHQGQTILQAARQNGVYVPSLCAMEHLPSYGACRLCMVEVDGIRGFPTACTTPVEEGMVIRTHTQELRTLRQEVLKLMLSEHPASCLFCDEQKTCKEYMGTIRKVGLTTGCRYCPNDKRCELQTVVDNVGLTETSYPVYYRGFPMEKYDPFYDRDYNLCILCGRCVRICNDVRLNGTLSFKQRGKQTTIGPAFDRSHIDAGCEFCGACVSVCPTGALAVKTSKWYGAADGTVGTTCAFCPVGCKLLVQVKNGEVIDVLPDYESAADKGLLCVKGRFAVPEYVHSPSRLTEPEKLTPIGYEVISWDDATSLAAEKLAGLKGDEFLMVISPQLSNEEIFAAQRFTRSVIGSSNIVSSVMIDLGDDLVPFLNLALASAPLDVIDGAGAITALGLDTTYGFSPAGVAIKKAVQRGALLATIDSEESNLSAHAEMSWEGDSGKWAQTLWGLADAFSPSKGKRAGKTKGLGSLGNYESFAAGADKAGAKVLILGPGLLGAKSRGEILEAAGALRDRLGWKVVVLHPYTNLTGLVAMGGIPGVEPGQIVKAEGNGKPMGIRLEPAETYFRKKRKVVYLVGEVPDGFLPSCDFLIYQNVLPTDWSRRPDLVLPASLFLESGGTVISADGRLLEMKKAVEPPGKAQPDWWILSTIAERLKKGSMRFTTLAAAQKEVKAFLRGFAAAKKRLEFVTLLWKGEQERRRQTARGQAGMARYRGIPLQRVVAGMCSIEIRGGEKASSGKE